MARPDDKLDRFEMEPMHSQLLDDRRDRGRGIAYVGLPIIGLSLAAGIGLAPAAVALHGMYLPVVAASYYFGTAGALTAAVLAALGLAFHATPATSLVLLLAYASVALLSARLLGFVDSRRRSVVKAQITTLKNFAVAVETEDEPAGEHCERVAANAWQLGTALGLDDHESEELYWAGLLHDIGKVTVPREILRKPGGLTLEEYLVMRRHARLGANLLSSIDSMTKVAEGVGTHHERWDGSGYPSGLKGEQIPLFGRILAVVDVFEALSSDRPYRRAMSRQEALEELRANAGSQFDPELVEVFERLYRDGKIRAASEREVAIEQPRLELQKFPFVDSSSVAAPAD